MQKATAFFVSSLLMMAIPTMASLPIEDRGNTTYDPNTGLEWLDLSFTAGRSYDEVVNGWGGYTTRDGYRIATRSEVVGLFLAFGQNPSDQQANLAAAGKALSSLGTTLPMPFSNLYRSWMNYDARTESLPSADHVPTAVFGTGEIGGGIAGEQGFFLTPGLFIIHDYQSEEIATALVRVVPEPPICAVGFVGFTILGLAARFRKRI